MIDSIKATHEDEDNLHIQGELNVYSKKTPKDIWELINCVERQLQYLSGYSELSLTRNQFYSLDKMNETITKFKGK